MELAPFRTRVHKSFYHITKALSSPRIHSIASHLVGIFCPYRIPWERHLPYRGAHLSLSSTHNLPQPVLALLPRILLHHPQPVSLQDPEGEVLPSLIGLEAIHRLGPPSILPNGSLHPGGGKRDPFPWTPEIFYPFLDLRPPYRIPWEKVSSQKAILFG